MTNHLISGKLLLFSLILFTFTGAVGQTPSNVTPDMLFNLTGLDNAWYLFDGDANSTFKAKHFQGFQASPAHIIVRLNPQTACALDKISFTPASGAKGSLRIYTGTPGPNGWTAINDANQLYDANTPGTMVWTVNQNDVDFIKFEFESITGSEADFSTGEITLLTQGLCSFYDTPLNSARQSAVSFDDFMGVNHFVGKTALAEFFGPFKNVREFLPWDHVQGHADANNNSSNGEDHDFHFSPCYPGYDLDHHYGNLHDLGKNLLADFKESAPFQMYFDYEGLNTPNGTANTLGLTYQTMGGEYLELMERKPGHPSDGVNPNSKGFSDPNNYVDHAQALYQTSLRYGQGGDASRSRFSDNSGKANQGHFTWIENWNEQDKWWNLPGGPSPLNSTHEQRLSYFTPMEYMAMTFADTKLADDTLTVPLVMSGISELDETYLRGMYMAWWELTGTDPAVTFPFYALNFHHYSLNPTWSQCVAPEEDWFFKGNDNQSPLARISNFTEKYLPGRQIWLSEFGYSDHPGDNTSATSNYVNQDDQEVQAQWLMRAFLRLYRYGIDRAFTYQLTDDGPNAWSGMFNHTGMIDRTDTGGWLPKYEEKKSWYYLYTMRQTLQDATFLREQNYIAPDGRPVKDYTFLDKNNDKIHALWVPKADSPTKTTIPLNVTLSASVQIIRPEHHSISGKTEDDSDVDGDGYISISGIGETPIFVKEGAPILTADCANYLPMHYLSGDQNAAQVLTDETATMALEGDMPRCGYGKNAMTRWEHTAGSVTLDLGSPGLSDTHKIEGIYLQDPSGQQGDLDIDLLDAAGNILQSIHYTLDGQAVFPFTNFGTYHVWKRYEDVDVEAAQIRLTKNVNAAIGELIVVAQSSQSCQSDNLHPTSPSQGGSQVSTVNAKLTWSLPNLSADASLIQLEVYDSIAQRLVKEILPITMEYEVDGSLLNCGSTYTASVRVLDCEGLYSNALIIPFTTAACAPPPPGPDPTCACAPKPLNLPATQFFYEYRNNQALPPNNSSFFDPCFDQADDKMPFRLMDEQNLASVNLICDDDYDAISGSSDFYTCGQAAAAGFPTNEWFPGWQASEYPYRAAVEFAGVQEFNGIYIYDGNDVGEFSIAFRRPGSLAWETLELGPTKSKILTTDQWRTWRLVYFKNDAIQAEAIRVTLYSPSARISEIMLCTASPLKKAIWTQKLPKEEDDNSQQFVSGKREVLPEYAEKHVMANGLSVFPNPTTEHVNLETISHHFTDVQLHDALGRPVRTAHDLNEDSMRLSFDVADLPPGVYYLQVQRKDRVMEREQVVVIDY